MPELPLLERPLRADRLAVRPYAERDIPEILIAYQDDPELHRCLGQRRPPSGAELGRAAEEAERDRLRGRRLWLTITEDRDDRCLGQVNLHTIRWQSRQGELALWVAPAARRRGYGSQALALAADWLLRHTSLRRLDLVLAADNEPMLRTALAAGARPAGQPDAQPGEHAPAGAIRYLLGEPEA
jgi:RimJ/RimL family protein N-acetyltransferase